MKKLLIVIFLLTISCTNNKVVKNHGLTALEIKANKIKLLKSNKNDVLNIIGKPSTVSLFDENSWFFIGREKVNQSVFKLGKSKIEKNNVLEVTFNTNDIGDVGINAMLANINKWQNVTKLTFHLDYCNITKTLPHLYLMILVLINLEPSVQLQQHPLHFLHYLKFLSQF